MAYVVGSTLGFPIWERRYSNSQLICDKSLRLLNGIIDFHYIRIYESDRVKHEFSTSQMDKTGYRLAQNID
jgi:hypothetical protein